VSAAFDSVTARQFEACLRDLGVGDADLLMVHSSLRSFGRFSGGPQAVVNALLKTVADGTVAMPTYTRYIDGPDAFDPAYSASDCGSISEAFRRRGDVVRQPHHPTHSMAFWGRGLKALIEQKPGMAYAHFMDRGGKTLLIGVGHETHSFVHWMLDEAHEAGLLARRQTDSPSFPRLEPWIERVAGQRSLHCGSSLLRLVDVQRCRDACFQALREEPDLFELPPTEAERAAPNMKAPSSKSANNR